MKIQLSDHFTVRRLLRFALPSILMTVFTSVYTVTDGFFVSNFAGKTPFAAVNFIFPVLMILGELGYMIGSGGTALIGKTLGEQNREKANAVFSLLVLITVIVGTVLAVIGAVFMRDIAVMLGADETIASLCATYGRICIIGLPAAMLQAEFQFFFVVAEKPTLGFYVTLSAGIINIILDALFVGLFGFGIVGAAVATVTAQYIGAVIPILYFLRKNTSLLRLGKPAFLIKEILQSFYNGLSEFISGISMSVVAMLYNSLVMEYAGEDGIAALGAIQYIGMVFAFVFIGYSVGTSPIISYHYGAKNTAELKNLLRKSLLILSSFALVMTVLAEALAYPLSVVFVGYDETLTQMTVHAMRYYALTFLFCQIPIFGSSFFTALNNGLISALISFIRTMVFQVGAVLLFSALWGLEGVWTSLIAAEASAAALTVFFWILKKKQYQY